MPGIKIRVSTEEAQTATKKLREDLDKLGATSKMTENQIKTLESRMLNKMGADKATKAVNRLANSVGMSRNEVAKFQESLAPSTFMDKMSNAFAFMKAHWIGITIGIGAALMVSKKFADSIKDVAMAGARYETLGVSMMQVGKNAGYLESEINAYDEALQKTGISMLESRANIAKMIVAQLDLTKVTELGRAAQHAAVLGGIDSSQAFERMIQGLVSGEIEIFKTMGIMVRWEAGYKKMEQQLGRTSGGLSETEKAQSRLNTVLEDAQKKTGVYESAMRTAGKQITSFPRYISDFKVIMGQTFNPATNALIEGATIAMKEFQNQAGRLEVQKAIKEMSEEFAKLVVSVGKDLPKAFGGLMSVFRDILPPFAVLIEYAGKINAAAALALRMMGKSPWGTKTSISTMKGGEAGKISGAGASWDEGGMTAAEAKILRAKRKAEEDLKAKKERDAAVAAEKAKAYPEEWKNIKRDLESTIALPFGEGEYIQYQEKLLTIKKKYDKIRQEDSVKNIGDSKLVNQAELVEQSKLLREYNAKIQKQKEEGKDGLWALEKELTAATATELRKREMVAEDAAQKQQLAALKAYELGAIDLPGYVEKTNLIWENEKNERAKIDREYYSQEKSQALDAQIAELDLMEASGLAHRKTVQQRIDILNEKIALEKYNLTQMKELEDPSGWQQKTTALENYNKEVATLKKELDTIDPKQSFMVGLEDIKNEWQDTGIQMYNLSKEIANSMQSAFSDFFFDAMTGKLKSFGDYVTSFLNSVARAISNVLAQQAVAGMIGYGQSLLSSSGGSVASYGGSVAAPSGFSLSTPFATKGFHSGGMYNEPSSYRFLPELAFMNAQRAHTGIGPDEKPVVIKKDEGIFTKGQMAALSPAQPQSVKIEIKNESGEKLQVKDSQVKFNMQEMIVTVWLDAFQRNSYNLRTTLGV
ncbi:MAG: hypothetical protein PHO27_13155 [Sulfuricurvum sp.]|nr:hypothetical protein [Sulfuricurvum sp.]